MKSENFNPLLLILVWLLQNAKPFDLVTVGNKVTNQTFDLWKLALGELSVNGS
mgnify:CR=1 FL=1